MYKGHKISVVIPALNEEAAIHKVIKGLFTLKVGEHRIIDDIIVCDNGSTDNTGVVAIAAGAEAVSQSTPGYGIACLTAIAHLSECDIVLFVDGDDSCFAEQALPMLNGIINGDDLAIGSRTLGHIEIGALTGPQLFGNWLSSRLITLFWGQKITDLGPFRAIKRSSLQTLDMENKTFGWTVEMQVKAIILGMQVNEYPVDSKIRIGQSKISGTVSGSIKAGVGILSMIAKLFVNQAHFKRRIKQTAEQL
ncbi:glycosyltransferase family 2 protein [Parashewanella spongiae]|uniref:Glycosyltransferase family 2 protein n=1 Tax=Parashewanella spongiae TaxID=342950 RepID=A0A3A6U219_9GAMM|nr:glycosyltransferase family 2 protein [Parashewanella spongiae]MCL1077738.1 glycosyltransferase family 2 protein [Parashewanella spongiae]RJY18061.1 glycosyltransferase family 2 protein [Parashewanella spongiae]